MTTAQTAQEIREPFAPSVLKNAGVPEADAVWFTNLPAPAKMMAMRSQRGRPILDRLRSYMQANVNMASAPLTIQ